MGSLNKNNRFTVLHRLLHWFLAGTMLVLFSTGFLRMTWMAKKTVVSTMESKLANSNLSKDEMVSVAKSLLKPMWEYHEVAAYIAAGLFVLRVLYMLIKGIKFPNPFKKNISLKNRMQGLTYVYFYTYVLAAIITGFYLQFGDGTFKEPMEMIHKWGLYCFPIFIVLHFMGIVIGELTSEKGIVSKMISGE